MSTSVVSAIITNLIHNGFKVEFTTEYNLQRMKVTKYDHSILVGFQRSIESPFYVVMKTISSFGTGTSNYFGQKGTVQNGCTSHPCFRLNRHDIKYLGKALKKSGNTVESIVDAIIKFHENSKPKVSFISFTVGDETTTLNSNEIPDGCRIVATENGIEVKPF